MAAYIFIGVLVVIAIFLIVKAAGKKKEEERNTKTAIKTSPPKPPVREHPGPSAFGGTKMFPVLYEYSSGGKGLWVCSACETENPQGQTLCSVCHAKR